MKFKDIKIGQEFKAHGNEFVKTEDAYLKNYLKQDDSANISFRKINSIRLDGYVYCSFGDREEVTK